MTERATRFMRENTFNGNLVKRGSVLRDGRIRYAMQDGTVFVMNQQDMATIHHYQFTPRFSVDPEKRRNRVDAD